MRGIVVSNHIHFGARDAPSREQQLRESIAELEQQYRRAEGVHKERIKSDLDYAKRELARITTGL